MNQAVSIILCRAFGDFVIALHIAVKNKSDKHFNLFASVHLKPLYNSLSISIPSNVSIQWIDLNISKNILSFFTNRYLFTKQCGLELSTLRNFINQNKGISPFYLERENRATLLSLIVGKNLRSVVQDQYVYQQYAHFFSTDITELEDIEFNKSLPGMSILIMPDSRQSVKTIDDNLTDNIRFLFDSPDAHFKVARFGIDYQNFQELVSLIQNADWVVGADSLPIHLAQLYNIPHFILYPANKKKLFFTPFALKHHFYASFETVKKQISLQSNGN